MNTVLEARFEDDRVAITEYELPMNTEADHGDGGDERQFQVCPLVCFGQITVLRLSSVADY